jgi:hypothetical protein
MILSLFYLFYGRNERTLVTAVPRGERMRLTLALLSLALMSACDRNPEQQSTRNFPAEIGENEAAPAIPPPATGPNARTPLAEPRGPIDPKSAEAAGQVVQHYGALIEQDRWAEAEKLWSDPRPAREAHASLKSNYSEVHVEIGKPGQTEGAAGSIYVSIPGAYYGKFKDGKPFRHSINFVLRRVNDVPGSTAAQRRWNIERIESTEEF